VKLRICETAGHKAADEEQEQCRRAHTQFGPGVGCAVGGSKRGSCSASVQLGDERQIRRDVQIHAARPARMLGKGLFVRTCCEALPGDSRPV
jgi:hypothetical protein